MFGGPWDLVLLTAGLITLLVAGVIYNRGVIGLCISNC